eukprot:CAMPEP_0183479482 /NCGR_PEP_ID=MMETSP0370-20130417/171666_1 /TAXON_ID=268820 /ORGANISM="Peridinium aciculiferum, Strain PAER-2" /LENGTH=475 /DNA_ID=CAMNT_0025672497 /DNA_START=72 /DNA_END=1496 /DNA_ORIENTATION=+
MELHVSASTSDGLPLFTLDPISVRLSSANEASARCMEPLTSVKGVELQARLVDEEGALICDSGPVTLCDEDWVCLSCETASGGVPSRLLSIARECTDGWTLFFDMKERSDTASVLRFVRIVKSRVRQAEHAAADLRGQAEAEAEEGVVAPQVYRPLHCTAVDCTEPESMAVHPKHSLLLQMFRQPDARLLKLSFWNSIAQGKLTVMQDPPCAGWLGTCGEHLRNRRSELDQLGYSRLQQLPWSQAGVSVQALSDTIDALKTQGLPPVFIFMYDQVWSLLLQLFDLAAQILDTDAVEMSLSVFAWALEPDAAESRVGSNFGLPHRDQTYDDCHTQEGHLTMLTTWIALVPVTHDSGCMYVLPSDRDELLTMPDDPCHTKPDEQGVKSLGEALPCDAGDVLTWRANTIHWGSSCTTDRVQPRKSMATMFGHLGTCKANSISKDALEAGVQLDTRLRIILRTLLQYKVWYPEFAGLSL